VLAERFVPLIVGEDEYSYYEQSLELTITDGFYTVPCLDGDDWGFRIVPPDRVEFEVALLQPARPVVLDVTAKMPQAGKIGGNVSDTTSAEQPVPGALVFANQTQHQERGWGITDSDALGNFQLQGLHAPNTGSTPYSLYAAAPGLSVNRRSNVLVQARQLVGEMNLFLSPTGRISGHVYDDAAQPIPNAVV